MSDGGADRERGDSLASRWRTWFLLTGPRIRVAGLTAGAFFAFVAVVTALAATPLRDVVALYYVLGGLVSGNLTLVTVVVAINQLLLSREFQTPEELRSHVDSVSDYRRGVEERAGRTAPVQPLGFLRLVVENMRQEAQMLGGLSRTEAGESLHDELEPVVRALTDDADRVVSLLDTSGASTFEVLSTVLTTNYAQQLNELRRIQRQYDARLPDDVDETIETLVECLQDIDVARQYFKTIYFQEELATLSRYLFYLGLASLAVVTAGLLVFAAPGRAAVPRGVLLVTVPVVVSTGFLPLCLLFAFIVRIATVTQRTAAILPFTTPDQEQ